MSTSIELTKISSYLTEDYINKHLTKWFREETQYTGHEFGKDAGKGDYYLSDVWKLTITGRKFLSNSVCSIKLVIKTLPQNIGRRNTFRSSGFFKNEINFYKLVLPELLEFQSEFRMTDPFDNTPNLFAAETDGENDFLAMEDLSVNGYNSYSRRQEGIDYNYFMSILNMFGKFHALSIAYKAHHPEEYESLEKLIFETYYAPEYETWYAGFWEKLCACAIDAVKKEFPGTIYENKIKEFAQHKTFQLMCNATNDNTAVRVISHGDSWTPNFLFNVNEDETSIKTKILDFQLARSASPVLDVSFFIYTTTSEKLRQDHYTNGLKYYHSIFSKQVSEMGCDPQKVYSFETFMSEVKKYSYFGLGFSLESIPVIVLEPDDAFQMDQIEGTDVIKIETIWDIKPMKKKTDRQRLANNVKHAVDNGFI